MRSSIPPDALTGMLVLVACDASDSRDLIKRVLEGAGASVEVAGSAREALAAIEREKPDAMIADIGMLGDDGDSLMRRIRAVDPGAGGRIPAVALSGLASAEDRAFALLAGYEELLPKPASPLDLVKVVERLVRRSGEHPS